MKIGVVHVTTEVASGPYTDLITANLDRAKSEGTEILHRYVDHVRRASDTAIAYPTMLNRVDVAAHMVALEADGADAVFVACSGDTAVAEARSLVSIPVVGPMEAAMALACGYGWRFGILTVEDRTWASWMEQAVQINGLRDRYVGLRRLHTPTKVVFTEGFENPALVLEDMEQRARELVQDGADAIVIGSAAEHVRDALWLGQARRSGGAGVRRSRCGLEVRRDARSAPTTAGCSGREPRGLA